MNMTVIMLTAVQTDQAKQKRPSAYCEDHRGAGAARNAAGRGGRGAATQPASVTGTRHKKEVVCHI